MSSDPVREIAPVLLEFEEIRQEQLLLCEELEAVADGLGTQPDRQHCIEVAARMEPVMNRAHEFEEKTFFPALQDLMEKDINGSSRVINRFLMQLKAEHEDDVCLAGEVVEALQEYGCGPSHVSPDAIGYLLRGFFVGLRRHLAFEEEVLRTLAGNE